MENKWRRSCWDFTVSLIMLKKTVISNVKKKSNLIRYDVIYFNIPARPNYLSNVTHIKLTLYLYSMSHSCQNWLTPLGLVSELWKSNLWAMKLSSTVASASGVASRCSRTCSIPEEIACIPIVVWPFTEKPDSLPALKGWQ